MDDLISRAAAIEALGERPYNWTDSDAEIAEVSAWESHKAAIENVPAVDLYTNSYDYKPVINAFWVEETDRNRHWHCSNCGKVQGITSIAMKYCPECGARMYEHPWAASGCGQAFSPD